MDGLADIPEPGAITRLLHAARNGDTSANDQLWPLVYGELRQVAQRQLRRERAAHTLCTTDLVHEAFFKLSGGITVDLEDRSHFYGIAARAMRQVLIQYARKRRAAKRGGDRERVTLTNHHHAFEIQLDELLALDQALDRLDALNERLRQVVEYRFFGGMTEREIAEVLGISTRTVERDWLKARLFLYNELYPGSRAPAE